MNAQMTSFVLAVVGILSGLVVLDVFGIAEQGSLKIAHKGTLSRSAIHAKETITGKTAALYQ